MTSARTDHVRPQSAQPLPWYRYPWPWIAIAIPAAAVAGGLFTLYLAISNPDPVTVDDQQYRTLRADLQAQPQDLSVHPAADDARDSDHGDG